MEGTQEEGHHGLPQQPLPLGHHRHDGASPSYAVEGRPRRLDGILPQERLPKPPDRGGRIGAGLRHGPGRPEGLPGIPAKMLRAHRWPRFPPLQPSKSWGWCRQRMFDRSEYYFILGNEDGSFARVRQPARRHGMPAAK